MIKLSKKICVLLLVSMNVSFVINAEEYIQFSASNLSKVKISLYNGQASKFTVSAYNQLIAKATESLTIKNPTVMNKTLYPPSNNKHDYLSISRYWWPDPKSETGLPWIRRDGITNPKTQTDDVDRNRLGKMTKAVSTLSLAYYFSGDERYAKKGISIIDTWFIDEDTKMNPHFQYSQSVPGNPNGRRSGILDGRLIPEKVIDAITIFSKSPTWSTAKQDKMTAWLADYFQWLTSSELGIKGAKQKNNHGSWYRFQVAALAWYLKDEEALDKIIDMTKESFTEQFDINGAQIHELKRTRGFFYSCFNLKALVLVANIAEKSEHDLWEYETSKGQSLQLAIDYLMPTVKGEHWPHNSKKIDVSDIVPALLGISINKGESEYKKALKNMLTKFKGDRKSSTYQKSILINFALTQPKFF